MLDKFRLIDLSVPLEHQSASEPMPARIHYVRHDGEGLQQMRHFLGVKPEDLIYSNGLGWAVEEVQAITHNRIPRPHGFYLSCLPIKIHGASAGWCRAVALTPEE